MKTNNSPNSGGMKKQTAQDAMNKLKSFGASVPKSLKKKPQQQQTSRQPPKHPLQKTQLPKTAAPSKVINLDDDDDVICID